MALFTRNIWYVLLVCSLYLLASCSDLTTSLQRGRSTGPSIDAESVQGRGETYYKAVSNREISAVELKRDGSGAFRLQIADRLVKKVGEIEKSDLRFSSDRKLLTIKGEGSIFEKIAAIPEKVADGSVVVPESTIETYCRSNSMDLSNNIVPTSFKEIIVNKVSDKFHIMKTNSQGAESDLRQLIKVVTASQIKFLDGSTPVLLINTNQPVTADPAFFLSEWESAATNAACHLNDTSAWNGTKQFGLPALFATAYSVATDSSNNVFVGGKVGGEIDTSYQDAVLIKYDLNGAQIWKKQFGDVNSSGRTFGYGVATDPSGNAYIGGATWGNLGSGSVGTSDFFVSKYDKDGNKMWAKQRGYAGEYTHGKAVTTDASSNVFVCGETKGNLDPPTTLTGDVDAFVAKHDTNGAHEWTKQLGAASEWTRCYAVAADLQGNVFVSGYTTGNLSGGPPGLSGRDAFVTKYDAAGNLVWTSQLGVSGKNVEAYGATTDLAGNVYIVGLTTGALPSNTLMGNEDFFLTKYDNNLTHKWTRQLGVASKDTTASAVTTDPDGNIYVTGETDGNLDGNILEGTDASFITKYDQDGTKIWTKLVVVPGASAEGFGIATNSFGSVFMGGFTTSSFNENPLSGIQDLFLSKFTPAGIKH